MVVLALDSTTPSGSVALDAGDGIVEVRAGDATRGWSERLPVDLLDLLAGRGLGPGDVDLFAVVAGPGSLTGVRVGIATVQGLAFATGRPVAAVSALEALAEHVAHDLTRRPPISDDLSIGAWTNAMRGEVFAELYRPPVTPGAPCEPFDGPVVATPEAVTDRWIRCLGTGPVVAVGDTVDSLTAPLRHAFGERLSMVGRPLLAPSVLRLAHRQWARGQTLRPHAIQPLYVRKPDAVLARERGAQARSRPMP